MMYSNYFDRDHHILHVWSKIGARLGYSDCTMHQNPEQLVGKLYACINLNLKSSVNCIIDASTPAEIISTPSQATSLGNCSHT